MASVPPFSLTMAPPLTARPSCSVTESKVSDDQAQVRLKNLPLNPASHTAPLPRMVTLPETTISAV